jgi:hypothetical protein
VSALRADTGTQYQTSPGSLNRISDGLGARVCLASGLFSEHPIAMLSRLTKQWGRRYAAGIAMNDEQFSAIRGLLVTIVILLGLIAGILLALAWEYL